MITATIDWNLCQVRGYMYVDEYHKIQVRTLRDRGKLAKVFPDCYQQTTTH